MPTFVVTMCGVLEDGCQDNEQQSGGGTHRITALDNPFMAGKHLWLELEGQEMVAIVKEGLAAITWPALVLLHHARVSNSHWLLQAPLPLPRAM